MALAKVQAMGQNKRIVKYLKVCERQSIRIMEKFIPRQDFGAATGPC
jgi:hypothetical protein